MIPLLKYGLLRGVVIKLVAEYACLFIEFLREILIMIELVQILELEASGILQGAVTFLP